MYEKKDSGGSRCCSFLCSNSCFSGLAMEADIFKCDGEKTSCLIFFLSQYNLRDSLPGEASANNSVVVINAEEPTISPWRTIVHEACYSSFRHTFKARECAPCDSLDSSSDFKSIELVEYIENSRFELFFEFELRNSTSLQLFRSYKSYCCCLPKPSAAGFHFRFLTTLELEHLCLINFRGVQHKLSKTL